jgi:hypothetical protein
VSELCPYVQVVPALKSPSPGSPASTAIPERSVETRQTKGQVLEAQYLVALRKTVDRAIQLAEMGKSDSAAYWLSEAVQQSLAWHASVLLPTDPLVSRV